MKISEKKILKLQKEMLKLQKQFVTLMDAVWELTDCNLSKGSIIDTWKKTKVSDVYVYRK